MKLALYQFGMIRGETAGNILSVENAVRTAAQSGADLLVLPEFWAVGWDLPRLKSLADSPGEGIFHQMALWAEKYSIGLMGTHPCKNGQGITNRLVLYDPQGNLIAYYDKIHLFSMMDEHEYVQAGDQLKVASTPWGKMGLATCFDLRFPEMHRQLALQGAEMIVIPAYWPAPRLHHWRLLLQARAVENQVYVVGVNRSRSSQQAFGYSAVIAPDGERIAEAGEEEALLFADFDAADVRDYRTHFPAFHSRKPGHYGVF